jgi:hypothetical protein
MHKILRVKVKMSVEGCGGKEGGKQRGKISEIKTRAVSGG